MPAPTSEICGSGSNCELLTVNGTKAYRFKRGFEPGSHDYQKRFYEMPGVQGVARRDDKVETKVVMGETMMQWGCETDVQAKIKDAINSACRKEGGCDEGSPKSFDIRKWEGTSKEPSDAKLNIRLDGKYSNEKAKNALQEALQATAKGDSVTTNDQKWIVRATPSGSHWGMTDRGGKCAEKQFPNYVAINRFENGNLRESMEFRAELVEGKKNCLGVTIMGAIAGAINPIAGKFFGAVKVLFPKPLQPGGEIAFISPSYRINNEQRSAISRAKGLLSSRGYMVRELFTPDTGIQSSIANRLSELRAAFSDSSVSAVICTIGGPSFTELLPSLIADTELHGIIRANPKIVVGYSDITGLHWFLHAMTGLRTFYGPGAIPELCEPIAEKDDGYEGSALAFCVKHLFRAITDPEPIGDIARSATYAPAMPRIFFGDPESVEPTKLVPATGWTWLRPGKAQGRLFGGCLTVMARLAGVQAIVPDWNGRIVFFETATGDDDVSGNPLERVRAGMADLIAQGVFENAAGLVVGRPFGYDSPERKEEYMNVIKGLLCDGRLAEKKFPILFNVDFGHTTPMVTLPLDGLAVLDSEKDQFAIIESVLST
ncbi:hypothetical protein JX265_009788 [Neoarthrinium moseri]|uniref:Uncharacterized protein n=1 Tax=Neoarthrinium moseri TaxID=1658444 RepID=A0A9Q0AME5_9PEZI|nr:hypothetical protein JX265_009788 [Neoarthrinium moseri]